MTTLSARLPESPAAAGPPPVTPIDLATGLAARPRTRAETGLGEAFLADLLAKHLFEGGVLDLRDLTRRSALPGAIVESVLAFLRAEGRVEVRGRSGEGPALRYALTDRGRSSALEALARDGYVGPAPVPLEQFRATVEGQTIRSCTVTREGVRTAFADTVIRESLLDQLGPALHSGRAMFVYGAPGTGKSYISRRLARLLGGHVLVPRSLAIGDSVVQYFDPSVHRVVQADRDPSGVRLSEGHDARYVLCERPVVVTGGELTLDMLELQYDAATRRYRAPLQLIANNGMLIIDDLGRQRVAPVDLFNRWIVPLEEKRDFLSLQNGQHFAVPFDVALIFSTNLNPLDLADEAFLRRIGYKIRFEFLDPGEYRAIWRQVCEHRGIACDERLVTMVLDDLHGPQGVPLLPCHPRDLIELALDHARYLGEEGITDEGLRWAWGSYFIRLS
jgi:hypothetical protein